MAWQNTSYLTEVRLKETKYSYSSSGAVTGPFFAEWDKFLHMSGVVNQVSVKTPGWTVRGQRNPYPPENGYSHERWTQFHPISSWVDTFYYPDGRRDVLKIVTPTSVYIDCRDIGYTWEFVPYAKALSRLHKELSTQKSSTLVTMAEAHKTARMIAQNATKIASAFGALKKGQLGKFADVLGLTFTRTEVARLQSRRRKALGRGFSSKTMRTHKFYRDRTQGDLRQFAANTWLEFSYGWKPLLSDIYSQAEALAEVLTEHQYVVRAARASARDEKRVTRDTVDGSEGLWKARVTNRQIARVAYVVRYKLQNGPATVANTFGLLNPAELAWELIPFSFVVDWFLPVGNMLQSLSATAGLSFHSGTETLRRTHQIEGIATSTGSTKDFGWAKKTKVLEGSWTGKTIKDLKSRRVLTDFPSPRWPDFKDPTSFAHAASAIALMQSVFLGSSRSKNLRL